MEGVGARLGRSSSRYGTTTVFSGPVRKWKKDWVPITPPSSNNNHTSNNHTHQNNNNNTNNNNNNGSLDGTVPHLRLYKWTPLSKTNGNNNKVANNGNNNNDEINNNNNNNNNGISPSSKDDDDSLPQEPPRRKFKYIPIAVLEEQKTETEENTDDEAKPADADEDTEEQVLKTDGVPEKPDINDVPMEENQDDEENQTAPARQDLNELDLSLGLTSHDEEHDSDSKTDGQRERPRSGSAGV